MKCHWNKYEKWVSVTHCTIFLATQTGWFKPTVAGTVYFTFNNTGYSIISSTQTCNAYSPKWFGLPKCHWKYSYGKLAIPLTRVRSNSIHMGLRCFYQFSKREHSGKASIFSTFQMLSSVPFSIYSHRTSHIIDLYSNSSTEIKIVYLRCRHQAVIILHFIVSIFALSHDELKLCVDSYHRSSEFVLNFLINVRSVLLLRNTSVSVYTTCTFWCFFLT